MKKDWVVAFGTEKFYITESDARFYVEQLASGAKFVVLKSGMVLSDKCLYVVKAETFDESDKLEAGKWQCKFNKWHSKEAECFCDIDFKKLPSGKIEMVKRNKHSSLAQLEEQLTVNE